MTINRGKKIPGPKEEMRKTSGPGPMSTVEKHQPGIARSVRA